MKLKPFDGFSDKAFQFLEDLKSNNNKEWFDENRKIYEKELRDKAKSLALDMSEEFAAAGLPYYADPKKSLFRINRDIRFSKNKAPYKTNIGVYFPFGLEQGGAKPTESVGLYFHLESDLSFVGAGMHSPPPPILKAIRKGVSENWDVFSKIIESEKLRSAYDGVLTGEELKTAPRGFEKDDPALPVLKKKSFTLYQEIPVELSESTEIMNVLVEKGDAAAEFLIFLTESMHNYSE